MNHEITVEVLELFQLEQGVRIVAKRSAAGWGLLVDCVGRAKALQPEPIQLEVYLEGEVQTYRAAYQKIEARANGWQATGMVNLPAGATVAFEDFWSGDQHGLHLERSVRVMGDAPGGFLSAMTFDLEPPAEMRAVKLFAPGMLYGSNEQITDVAIGGRANEAAGIRALRIREDRLPAPLFGMQFEDGWSVAVLNERPDGRTIVDDAHDVSAEHAIIDEGLRFAALGLETTDQHLHLGFWFPGTEGGATYSGNTYPNGQLQRWRRRYHPIRNGLTQDYAVGFRWAQSPSLSECAKTLWRWAWQTLAPRVELHDIPALEPHLVKLLADLTIVHGDLAGIPLHYEATDGSSLPQYNKGLMGFVGRNIEAAYYLLHAADNRNDAEGTRYRELAIKIIDSFARLPSSPPIAEGFDLMSGEPRDFMGGTVFLRSLAEGGKDMLRAWQLESARGVDHDSWSAWFSSLGDWFLGQQQADGGFPRGWKLGSGELESESLKSSYNAITFLLLLSEYSSDSRYLDAALRTAEFCWLEGHGDGIFVGGTVDNPDVVDKEAGTVSLEAYLALFERTQDVKWLERARAAADFAETWIYIWNVPMAEDDDDTKLHWKSGVSTVGLQLIASGHSLVDSYMAWDVGRYAKLYKYTGDRHYLEVAAILLHNTKLMIALPERPYDLAGPGWQQEHWSLAPHRGYGLHRYWLPWMTVSHLEGIIGLREFDAALYEELLNWGA
jgi:hypothetical protein